MYGKMDLTFPRVRRLQTALNNLSKDTSRKNVEYLMAIAKSNQYGLNGNSALRKYLAENSVIGALQLENNDWNGQLKSAIHNAIKKLPKNQQEAFEYNYQKIFIAPQELTNDEKKLIKYREYIIHSKPMHEALKNEAASKMANKAIMHMDYFIASSETPIKERVYVLSKLAHFLSDKYKIDAQLKDDKAEIFSQIINDLVVKTPQGSVLTTKDCSQEKSGSCAAISMARKAILYEDKKA